jgi:hypothetical protein
MENIMVKTKDGKIYLAIDSTKSVGKTKYGLDKVAQTNRFETIATIGDVEYGLSMVVTARPAKKAQPKPEEKKDNRPLPKPEAIESKQQPKPEVKVEAKQDDFPF